MDDLGGLDSVLENLAKEIEGIKGRLLAGLLEAGLKVEAVSNENISVEYGDTRGSSYAQKNRDGSLGVEVGYTSDHAVYLHENLEQVLKGEPRPSGLGNYWGPNGGPLFLENAVSRNHDAIIDIIYKRAKIK